MGVSDEEELEEGPEDTGAKVLAEAIMRGVQRSSAEAAEDEQRTLSPQVVADPISNSAAISSVSPFRPLIFVGDDDSFRPGVS